MQLDQIVTGDNLKELAALPENSIDLCIAMPPAPTGDYDAYLSLVRKWLAAIARVMKPGRRVVWIVANLPGENGLHPLPHDSVWLATNAGLVLKDEFVWNDPADQTRFPPGSFPFGPSVRLHSNLHYGLVLAKPNLAGKVRGKYDRLPELAAADKVYNLMDTRFYRERVARQVWDLTPCRGVRLPLALVEACIRLWSRPGEVVLDPFEDGTTSPVALAWKRRFVGIAPDDAHKARATQRLEACRIQAYSEDV